MNNNVSKQFYLRDAVGEALLSLGINDEQVVFISADVMSSCRVLKSLELFPERAFNVGIAEQDMISFAAGMAKEGFVPYTFTMAPFMSMRACEQVRTDVALNNLNVKMIAPYAGVSGGISGATHWSIEDCAIMNAIPGITIIEPSDPIQARKMVQATRELYGPVYMRIGIEPVYKVYDDGLDYTIGKANKIKDGNDAAFICSGITVKYALEAAERLNKEHQINAMVIDMHTIKPIDEDIIKEAAKTGNIIVAQDHNVVGGLGSIVSSVIAQNGIGVKFRILGIPDRFVIMAHAPFLHHKYGYDTDGLFYEMLKLLDR